MAAEIKGLGLSSIRKWTEQRLGPAGAADLYAQLSPQHRSAVERPWVTSWVDVAAADALFDLVRIRLVGPPAHEDDLAGTDAAAIAREFRATGRFVAEQNLNSVLRAFLTLFITPKQFFNNNKLLWRAYFRGFALEQQLDADGGGGTFSVRGLGELRYLAPIVYGWNEVAFQHIGVERIQVSERNFAAGRLRADPLIVDLRWA